MHNLTIDLNADLGESPERLSDGSDTELMSYITSANVACGGHAGDASTMETTLQLARQHNVAIGAHPSYPDRAGFGRSAMNISAAALEASIAGQLNELIAIVRRLKMTVAHVKPHGALYHACNSNSEIAETLGRTVLAIDSGLIVVGQAGAPCLEIYRQMGLHTAAEAFADRAYETNGSLRDRKLPGALLESPQQAAEQALAIVTARKVITVSSSEHSVSADTLCIHSDTPNAASIGRAVKTRLAAAGVLVQAFGR